VKGRTLVAAALVSLWPVLDAQAGDPEAAIVLRVSSTLLPGQVGEAMPWRFVLLEDGTVYVGGTSGIASARLDGGDVRKLEKGLESVRKLKGLAPRVAFGPGESTYRLVVQKGRALDITATGDPAFAPPALRPLAAFVGLLAEFDHPSLRPYRPTSYALSAREGRVPGGCRSWAFPVSLAQVVASPQTVAASAVQYWPKGANAASICGGDKNYLVTLRPLLPGERP